MEYVDARIRFSDVRELVKEDEKHFFDTLGGRWRLTFRKGERKSWLPWNKDVYTEDLYEDLSTPIRFDPFCGGNYHPYPIYHTKRQINEIVSEMFQYKYHLNTEGIMFQYPNVRIQMYDGMVYIRYFTTTEERDDFIQRAESLSTNKEHLCSIGFVEKYT